MNEEKMFDIFKSNNKIKLKNLMRKITMKLKKKHKNQREITTRLITFSRSGKRSMMDVKAEDRSSGCENKMNTK